MANRYLVCTYHRSALTVRLMILSNNIDGGKWKSNTKYWNGRKDKCERQQEWQQMIGQVHKSQSNWKNFRKSWE